MSHNLSEISLSLIFTEEIGTMKYILGWRFCIILAFILQGSITFSQVDCNQVSHDFSGECEGYDRLRGFRSTRNFKEGKLHGNSEEFYKSGQLRYKAKYSKDFMHGKFVAYYQSGEQMTSGKFRGGSGDFIMYHPNGKPKLTGSFYQGAIDGDWLNFNEAGEFQDTLKRDGFFRDDMLAYLVGDAQMRPAKKDFFGQMFDMDGFFGENTDSIFTDFQKQIDDAMRKMQDMLNRSDSYDTTIHFNFSDSTGSFEHIEFFGGEAGNRASRRVEGLVDFPDAEPTFPGGDEARDAFVKNNIQLTDDSKNDGATIFIEAIINEDGTIEQPQIALAGLRELEIEALRVVRMMPNWNPAIHRGEKVKTRMIIPVKFKESN
tara:strand:- start:371 stop:1492 length:1122 start_codon:yes stop_codon:yes gene_type:complete